MAYCEIDEQGCWWWMNPPDAKEGDECLYDDGEWRVCPQTKKWPCDSRHRRLIKPGTNAAGQEMEIVEGDTCISKDAEFTSDGVEWKRLWNHLDTTPNELLKNYDNIIAIRRPKKQEQWPRYWIHFVKEGKDLFKVDQNLKFFCWMPPHQWYPQHGIADIEKWKHHVEWQEITPTEAQAIMGQTILAEHDSNADENERLKAGAGSQEHSVKSASDELGAIPGAKPTSIMEQNQPKSEQVCECGHMEQSHDSQSHVCLYCLCQQFKPRKEGDAKCATLTQTSSSQEESIPSASKGPGVTNGPPSQPLQGEGEQFPWTRETINIINSLTTEIKGKAANPDWFLLRNRFENMEARLKQSESQHQPPKPFSVKERLPVSHEEKSALEKADEILEGVQGWMRGASRVKHIRELIHERLKEYVPPQADDEGEFDALEELKGLEIGLQCIAEGKYDFGEEFTGDEAEYVAKQLLARLSHIIKWQASRGGEK
jgi:hypothetical protein